MCLIVAYSILFYLKTSFWVLYRKIKYLSPELVISREDRHSWVDEKFIGGKIWETIL